MNLPARRPEERGGPLAATAGPGNRERKGLQHESRGSQVAAQGLFDSDRLKEIFLLEGMKLHNTNLICRKYHPS